MDWIKYPSVGVLNNKIREQQYPGEWVVHEKLHGANFSFLCDGKTIRHARRNAVLEIGEHFFNHDTEMLKYHKNVTTVYNIVKVMFPNIKSITVYGEYIGGGYSGCDTKNGLKRIQKEVQYTPEHVFVPFDIAVDGDNFVGLEHQYAIFLLSGFPHNYRELYRGTFQECINFEIENVVTHFPRSVGLPDLESNYWEGVVIRSVEGHILFKNKCLMFAERKGVPRVLKDFPDLPNFNSARESVTHGRVINVRSHDPSALQTRAQVPSFSRLVVDDIVKELEIKFDNDHQEKKFRKKLNKEVSCLVHRNFNKIV